MHPDVQLKAQKEVDSVVGPDRLPEFSDMSNLTFISAIVKEVFRFVYSPLLSECSHVYYQVEPCPTSRIASCDNWGRCLWGLSYSERLLGLGQYLVCHLLEKYWCWDFSSANVTSVLCFMTKLCSQSHTNLIRRGLSERMALSDKIYWIQNSRVALVLEEGPYSEIIPRIWPTYKTELGFAQETV